LRRVFENVVAMCIAAGLVGGEAFSVDASLIKADVDEKKRMPGDQPIAWPKAEQASRAVREYLAALDAAHGDEKDGGGDVGGSTGSGSRSKSPKEVSLTDPQAAWVARPGMDPFFAYDVNYLIDNKLGIILDAEGTRANRIAEIAVTQTMVERVSRRFDLRPQRLAGDTVYGAVSCSSGWWIARSRRTFRCGTSWRPDGTFSRADFVFDRQRNIYVCPGGAELTSTGNVDQGHIVYNRANKNDATLWRQASLECWAGIAPNVPVLLFYLSHLGPAVSAGLFFWTPVNVDHHRVRCASPAVTYTSTRSPHHRRRWSFWAPSL
jgi:hypothetical protein